MRKLLLLFGLLICADPRAQDAGFEKIVIFNDAVFYIQPGVTVQGGGVVDVPGAGSGNALLHDATGAELLNDSTGATLLNDNS